MKSLKNKILFKPRTVVLLAGFTLASGFVFQNCSQGTLQGGASGASSAASATQVATKASSVSTTRQMSRSMMEVTGLTLSQVTLGAADPITTGTVRQSVLSAISNTGTPESVNGPEYMARENISALYCIDVITQEIAKVKAGRTPLFTSGVNLWLPASTISDSQIQAVATTMARAFWRANPTDDEMGMILSTMSSAFGSVRMPATTPPATLPDPTKATVNADTQRMMYFLCSAMLGSMKAHVR